jgi:hypothetical protein
MRFRLEKNINGGSTLKRVETQGNDSMSLTNEGQVLWDQGYRPYEIYTYNKTDVVYCGEVKRAGAVLGWGIEFIFSTREKLKTYPYFDAVIGVDCMASVEGTWHG